MASQFSAAVLVLLLTPALSLFAQDTTLPAGWFKLPGTELRMMVGGYIKLDVIHDLKPIGSPEWFDVRTIPVTGQTGTSSRVNAKETRLFTDVRTTSPIGELRGYVEGDFYGSGGSFRLRRAFAVIDNALLAGQEWSTFMDENVIPPTLDFEKPGAYAMIRLPQVRYTHSFSSALNASLSIENPSTSGSTSIGGSFTAPWPAIAARVRASGTWGHVQLSGYTQAIDYALAGAEQTTTLYGGALSGELRFLDHDRIFYQALAGAGVAYYRGGSSVVITSDSVLTPVDAFGVTLGIEHHWSASFSSAVVGNFGRDDLAQEFAADTKDVAYVAANLLWHYAPASFIGIEYLYGSRELVNGSSGTADRIQASVRYAFNMK